MFTVIEGVVNEFDHKFPVADDEFNTTDPPGQKNAVVPFKIDGLGGSGLTVTVIVFESVEHPPEFVTNTV